MDAAQLAPGNIADSLTVLSPPGKTTDGSRTESTLAIPGQGASITQIGKHQQAHHGNGNETHEEMALKMKRTANWLSKVVLIPLVAAGGLLGISTSATAATG